LLYIRWATQHSLFFFVSLSTTFNLMYFNGTYFSCLYHVSLSRAAQYFFFCLFVCFFQFLLILQTLRVVILVYCFIFGGLRNQMMIRVYEHEFPSFFRVNQHDFQSNVFQWDVFFVPTPRFSFDSSTVLFFSQLLFILQTGLHYSTFIQTILIALYSVG